MRWSASLRADLTPLRASGDFRLLYASRTITALGTRASEVALLVQAKQLTGSAFAVGLLGAVELVPLVVCGLYGGVLADRLDRRALIRWCEAGLACSAAILTLNGFLPRPAVWPLYAVTGLMMAMAALQGPSMIGGFNSNELLPHLDWDLIRANPKVLCGFSDITALQNAIHAHTGLVTYSGPHYSSFAMRDHNEDTVAWFADCLMSDQPLRLRPAATWTDDEWWADQDTRNPRPNAGWWVLREGRGAGTILGGNLCTFNLLQGTPHMPAADRWVLFIEDDYDSRPHHFARNLTSLLQAVPPEQVSALLIGRFQAASEMTRPLLTDIVSRQPLRTGTAVVANLDFGHTSPLFTFPVGGSADVVADPAAAITITH